MSKRSFSPEFGTPAADKSNVPNVQKSTLSIWRCYECGSEELVFDRSICACGLMHYYCGGCGVQDDDCDPDGQGYYLDYRTEEGA